MIPRTLLFVALVTIPLLGADSLANRIRHPEPTTYRELTGVHSGAGGMSFGTLMPAGTIHQLRFIHRGVINPKSGIGHHMHNSTEEMFVVFGGNVQFTVNGHTAAVQGPVGVPVRLGQSHALYNAGDEPVQWMNMSIARSDMPELGRSEDPTGSVDLGDDRVGVTLDKVPAFLTSPFDRSMLRPVERMHGGSGTAAYARKLGPSFFRTNWAYVDHLLLPPGASVGKHLHNGVEEFYYVMNGAGRISVNNESEPIAPGDAIPILSREAHGIENNGSEPLEVMIIGVAFHKGVLDSSDAR